MSEKKKFTKERFDEVCQVKDRQEKDIFKKKGVVAAGVGRKNKDGELGIVVYVEKKLPLEQLAAEDLVPSDVDGVITDVVETGLIVADAAYGDHGDRYRPVQAGVSAIRVGGTACTLGAIVYKEGKAYSLHNAHCIYPHWNGSEIGDPVMQPSPNDGGDPDADIIGYTYDGQEITFDGSDNTIDAAIAELSTNYEFYSLFDLGTLDPTPATVEVDETVHKSGRTTGVTTTTVSSVNGTSNTSYSGGGGTAHFVNQIIVHNPNATFSAGGDSSSLVVNASHQPIGLLYASSSTPSPSGITVVNPIADVIDRFGISFEKPWQFEGKKLVTVPRTSVGRITHEGKSIDALTTAFSFNNASGEVVSYPVGTRINYLYNNDGEIIYYDANRVRVEIVS